MPTNRGMETKCTGRFGWVIAKITRPKGRRLRVLIYARYSTDEQNPNSIEAQVEYCRMFLTCPRITDAEIMVLSDCGVSGDVLIQVPWNRPV